MRVGEELRANKSLYIAVLGVVGGVLLFSTIFTIFGTVQPFHKRR